MRDILLTRRALKDLNNIEKGIQNRILTKLREYERDPFKYGRKLTSPKIGTYRFRIGDYRIIFDIDGENIVILRIGHRKDVYK